MIYCISDVHGEYDRYMAMLDQIRFSDSDTLYMLGDAIDRGRHGVKVLLDVMERPNAVFLLGNHEQMCLDTLHWRDSRAREHWRMNHGGVTRRDLLYRRTPATRANILKFLLNAPTFINLEVGGKKFHLVHGGPGETVHERVWNRPQPASPPPIADTTVIIGHTPTTFLVGGPLPLIWHGNGVIDIDCGCGHEGGRLAALRLDDMAEFYV